MIIDFEYYVNSLKQIEEERRENVEYNHFLLSLHSNIYYKDGDDYGFTDEEFIALCYCKRICHYVQLDAIQGCLIGGAIGDAFGFSVEFYEDCDIFKKYGENGITELQLYGGVAHFSDDTQMSLFTCDGLISASKHFENPTADDYIQFIYESYMNWLYTQDNTFVLDEKIARSDLLKFKELHQQRGPGRTCLTSLQSGECGTFTYKLNDSKGCGGIMRVAPIALFLAQIKEFEVKDVALVAARSAAITHSHALGYIPAAYLAAFLCYMLQGDPFARACSKSDRVIKELFPDSADAKKCLDLVRKARDLAYPDEEEQALDDLEAIRMLGEGWVAEETLAIAMYCAFKYSDDFEKAIIAAANHSGDSDSTAAVTGNILGAYWGLRRLPQKMVEHIELKEVMLDLAEKMHLNKLSTEVK